LQALRSPDFNAADLPKSGKEVKQLGAWYVACFLLCIC
jgi:hypothetical protein